jgi:hypothetical protein
MNPDQVTGGTPNAQAPGTVSAYPMSQEAHDDVPVVNIPASAVPPGMATAPHPQQMGAAVKVHGQDVQLTHEQLVTAAQKGMAADENFQAAAAKSKEAEVAIAFLDDMKTLAGSGDISAFRRAGATMGLTGDQVEEAARVTYEHMEAGEGEGGGANENEVFQQDEARRGESGKNWAAELAQVKASIENKQVRLEDLSPDLQDAIVDVERVRIDKIVKAALDSDQTLRYYMDSYDAKGQEAIRGMVNEKIKGRLDASNERFGDGTQIMQEVLPEVKNLLNAVGTPERSTPQMGLGPAPGGQGPDIYPMKKPDHVSSSDAGWEEHIGQDIAHNVRVAQG